MSSHRIGLLVPSSNTTMAIEVPDVLTLSSAISGEHFTFHASRTPGLPTVADEAAALLVRRSEGERPW